MINSLNVFLQDTNVVAEEWNANFSAISQSNTSCADAIEDANNTLAFPNDLSGVYSYLRRLPNSTEIPGNDITVHAEKEYYKSLSSTQNLQITIPVGMNGEARIAIYIPNNRSQKPFDVNYKGAQKIINHYNDAGFDAGYYYIMIYETAGIAYVKLIWTGA